MIKETGSTTVLYLDHTGKLGGAEVAMARLMGAIDRKRFQPIVVFADEGAAPALVRATGAETHVLPLDGCVREVRKDTLNPRGFLKPRRLLKVVKYAVQIARFIRENGVQIVHTNSLKAHIYGGIAGRLAGVPVVWHLRDFIDTTYLPRTAVGFVRFLAKWIPKHVVTDSQSVMNQVHLTSHDGKATAILNGIPLSELPAVESLPQRWHEPVRIGILGRIAPWKGQHVFLKAAARVRQLGYKAKFVVIGAPLFGEYDYEADLRAMTQSLGVENDVEFLGFRSDVAAVLRDLDILVHASTSADPCPSTVLEGMAYGLPVIGSDGGGVPEMIVEGKTGLLVPMGDSDKLAEAIRSLLDNPEKALSMGRAGHTRVKEHFTTARVARQVEDVYARVLPKPKLAASHKLDMPAELTVGN